MAMEQYVFETPPIKWEQKGEVLEADGLLCSVGTFTTEDGTKVTFDKSSINNIHSNIQSNFKLWLGHGSHLLDDPIGWSTKFGINDDGESLFWRGLVFDKDGINQIMFEGYDKTSMEILLELDESGYVRSGMLTGNAFVKRPAIEKAIPTLRRVAMGAPNMTDKTPKEKLVESLKAKGLSDEDIETILKDIGMTDEPINPEGDGTAPKQEPPSGGNPPTQAPAGNVTPPVGGNLGAPNMSEIEDLKNQVASLTQMFSAKKQEEYDTLVGKLKSFGIADPESIVIGLPIDNKIAVLRNFSERVVSQIPLTKPLVVTPEQKATLKATRNVAFQAAIRDLCLEHEVAELLDVTFGGE